MAMLVRTLRSLPRASTGNGVQAFAARWISTDAPLAAPVTASVESEEIATPKFSVVNHQVTTDAIKPEDYFAVIKLGGTQYKVTQVRSYNSIVSDLTVCCVRVMQREAVY